MRHLHLIALPILLLSSCALESEKKKKADPLPKKKKAPETVPVPQPVVDPTPVIRKADPGLEYMDPVTANEFITEKDKRMVSKQELSQTNKPEIEGDSEIKIDPPKLPVVKLPDES